MATPSSPSSSPAAALDLEDLDIRRPEEEEEGSLRPRVLSISEIWAECGESAAEVGAEEGGTALPERSVRETRFEDMAVSARVLTARR